MKMLISLKEKVQTRTVDKGKEFAHHKKIAKPLDSDIYFAHLYGFKDDEQAFISIKLAA